MPVFLFHLTNGPVTPYLECPKENCGPLFVLKNLLKTEIKQATDFLGSLHKIT